MRKPTLRILIRPVRCYLQSRKSALCGGNVRPSLTQYQSSNRWTEFHKIRYGRLSLITVEKFRVAAMFITTITAALHNTVN
jgi:hypothetical protein